MTRTINLVFAIMIFCATGMAQNQITANQNQQNININVPVIEKEVYINKYRTVYVEKPRVARKLSAPVKLLGYLWVYPEDIGNFNNVPVDVLLNINNTKPYGRNNWRMPTPDELAILESNADAIGLGDEIYLATDHRNGVLRLVATDGIDYSKVVRIGETYWTKCNFGTERIGMPGRPLTYQEAVDKAPAGYRLPTEEEALELIYSGEVLFGIDNNDREIEGVFNNEYVRTCKPKMSSSIPTQQDINNFNTSMNQYRELKSQIKIEFPFTRNDDNNNGNYTYFSYWVQGEKIIYVYLYHDYKSQSVEVKVTNDDYYKKKAAIHVRYVLDN